MAHFDPLNPAKVKNLNSEKTKMADGLCPDMSAVDILKATQQGAAPVRCGCRLWVLYGAAYWRHL